MAISFIRTIILYFLIIFAIRTTGKRQIGQLSPAELVITILMSQLAVIPMQDMKIPLLYGAIPILSLVAIEFIISLITLKNIRVREFVNGHSVIIIRKGVIEQNNMKKIKLSIDELMEELRMQSVFDILNVDYAIMETNGSMSLLLKKEYQPITKDLVENKDLKENELSMPLIIDGRLLTENINKVGIKKSEIEEELRKEGIADIKSTFYMASYGKNSYNIIKKNTEEGK